MNDKQPIILVVGGALIVANLILGGQGKTIFNVIYNGQEAHNSTVLKDVLWEGGLLLVLILLAGLSDDVGNVVLWFLVALWLVFLYNRFSKK